MAESTHDLVGQSFQAAYDLLPMGIVIVDDNGVIALVNRYLEQLLGYERSELVGKAIECLVPKRLLQSHRAMRRGYARDATQRPMGGGRELQVQRRNGEEVPVEIGLCPVFLGGKRYIVSTLIDVSERRELESQLQQMQKEVVIGSLVSGLAHDFNNILLGILGNAELSKGVAATTPEVLGNLEVIIENTLRGRDLVGQILHFTRKRSLVRHPVRWETIIHDSIRLMRASLPANVRLHLRTESDVPNVVADPLELQQVVMNVVTNAIHSMSLRGGTIDIRLTVQHASGDANIAHRNLPPTDCVCLSVNDEGTGMSPAVLEQVFTPYFTTKPPGKGTGLGMSVTLRIVKGLGGTIAVNSREGQGTQVDICIPTAADITAFTRGANSNGDDPPNSDPFLC